MPKGEKQYFIEPSSTSQAITPSDTVDIVVLPANGSYARIKAIYVGGAGDIVTVDEADVTTTWKSCPVGLILPIRCKRVNSTGTTATFLVAFT